MKTDDELRGAAGEPNEPEKPAKPATTNTQRGMDLATDWQPPDKRITLALFVGLIALLGFTGGWPLLVVVFAIVVMICLHELGHYITAKASGMKVTEFFLGFGPRLWSFRRGETEYGVKAIPAGAYVRIIGMNSLEEVPPEDELRTYRQQTYPRRLMVATAGSAMHFLLTLICLFMVLAVTGAPGGHVFQQDDSYWRIVSVLDGSPAQTAGLQPNDRIVATDGQPVTKFDEVKDFIGKHPGEEVTLDVERNGQRLQVAAVLASESGHGKLGVSSSQFKPDQRVSPITAIPRAFSEFGSGVRESFAALGHFFSPSGISNFVSQVASGGGDGATVTGTSSTNAPESGSSGSNEDRPLSIFGAAALGSDLTRDGLYEFLAFFLTINMFIGIVNLMPLLPLDGGHVAVATYERLRSRRGRRYQVDIVKLLPLTYVVVMLLGLLFVGSLFLDIVDPIRLN